MEVGVPLPFKVSLCFMDMWKQNCVESRYFSRSLVQPSAPSRVNRSDYYGISGLENHKMYPALPPLPVWIGAQLFSGYKGFSLNLVCASHFSLCPVSSYCAVWWWECLHLLGNLKGSEGLLLDAPGAVMSSGWTCLGTSAFPQRACALILINLVVLCWAPLLGNPKSVHSIPNTM